MLTETLLPVATALLGAVLASFAGVIAERMHTGDSWLHGRSRCNSCGRTLAGFDLVPIVSWLVSLGRCSSCKVPVPYRYALAELTLATLYASSALVLGATPILAAFLAFLFILAVAVQYDLRHTIVPAELSFLLIASALAYAVLGSRSLHEFGLRLLVAGSIALGFFLMHALSKGKWMGLGDTPVALSLSLVAGPGAIAGLLFSFWIGAAIGIAILALTPPGHRMGIEVPFVPFLAAGYLLAYFTQWNPFLL